MFGRTPIDPKLLDAIQEVNKDTSIAEQRRQELLKQFDVPSEKALTHEERVKFEQALKESLEPENLQELSKKTLGRYVTKAVDDMGERNFKSGMKAARGDQGYLKLNVKNMKRQKSVNKAVDKIVKEDSLQELTKAKLNAYKAAAADHLIVGNPDKEKDAKRSAGLRLAMNKTDRKKPTKHKFPYTKLRAGMSGQTTNAKVLATDKKKD